jgi:hypothetical protein
MSRSTVVHTSELPEKALYFWNYKILYGSTNAHSSSETSGECQGALKRLRHKAQLRNPTTTLPFRLGDRRAPGVSLDEVGVSDYFSCDSATCCMMLTKICLNCSNSCSNWPTSSSESTIISVSNSPRNYGNTQAVCGFR